MKKALAPPPDSPDENPEIENKIVKLKQQWEDLASPEHTVLVSEVMNTGRYSIRRLAKRVGRDEGTLRNCLKKRPRPTGNIQPDSANWNHLSVPCLSTTGS